MNGMGLCRMVTVGLLVATGGMADDLAGAPGALTRSLDGKEGGVTCSNSTVSTGERGSATRKAIDSGERTEEGAVSAIERTVEDDVAVAIHREVTSTNTGSKVSATAQSGTVTRAAERQAGNASAGVDRATADAAKRAAAQEALAKKEAALAERRAQAEAKRAEKELERAKKQAEEAYRKAEMERFRLSQPQPPKQKPQPKPKPGRVPPPGPVYPGQGG